MIDRVSPRYKLLASLYLQQASLYRSYYIMYYA